MNKTLVLMDFDGTLCKIDSFTGFFRFAYSPTQFYLRCLPITKFIASYSLGYLGAPTMRPILAKQFLKNQPIPQLTKLANQYAHQIILQNLNKDVLAKLYWHKQRQHQICIVSAGLDIYLHPIAQLLKIDLICTHAQTSCNSYTGFYQSADCSLDAKVHAVQAKFNLNEFDQIYSYGNSHEDFPMLRLAHHPFWVDEHHKLHPFAIKSPRLN